MGMTEKPTSYTPAKTQERHGRKFLTQRESGSCGLIPTTIRELICWDLTKNIGSQLTRARHGRNSILELAQSSSAARHSPFTDAIPRKSSGMERNALEALHVKRLHTTQMMISKQAIS